MLLTKPLKQAGQSRRVQPTPAQVIPKFSCCTSIKVQILTPEVLTSRKVQILTPEVRMTQTLSRSEGFKRLKLYATD